MSLRTENIWRLLLSFFIFSSLFSIWPCFVELRILGSIRLMAYRSIIALSVRPYRAAILYCWLHSFVHPLSESASQRNTLSCLRFNLSLTDFGSALLTFCACILCPVLFNFWTLCNYQTNFVGSFTNQYWGNTRNVPGYQNIPTLYCYKVSCFVFNYWIQIEFIYNWICILSHAIYITGCYPLIWSTKHFRYCFIYVATNSFNTFVLIKHPLNLIRLPHIHWLNSNHCFWWTLYLLHFHKHDVLFLECCSTETNITISRSELHTLTMAYLLTMATVHLGKLRNIV